MKLSGFMKDHIFSLIIHILCMIVLSIFLRSIGLQFAEISIVIVCWIIVLFLFFAVAYYQKSKRLTMLYQMAVNLDEKYLISEVIGKAATEEEDVYFQILKMANKSMLEQVSAIRRERKEYKGYIEQWIHEVKTPISAICLLCENNKSDFVRELLCEMGKLGHFVEQALFFARMEEAEKDYLIKEVVISEIVDNVIVENKQLLLGNSISIEFDRSLLTAYTDRKWIEFILNQLIVNAKTIFRYWRFLLLTTTICGICFILIVYSLRKMNLLHNGRTPPMKMISQTLSQGIRRLAQMVFT